VIFGWSITDLIKEAQQRRGSDYDTARRLTLWAAASDRDTIVAENQPWEMPPQHSIFASAPTFEA